MVTGTSLMSHEKMLSKQPHLRAVFRAIEKTKKHEEQTEACYFCGGRLKVHAGAADGKGAHSFRVTCRCGKSNGEHPGT